MNKREQTKLQNRQAIIQAAREVFLELGFDGCHVRDIIRRTGLASGTFYNYFPDKVSVFKALIDDFIQELSMRIHQTRESADSLESFVANSYLSYFQGVAADPVSYELARRNENVIGNLYESSVMEMMVTMLSEDIHQAIAKNIIPELDVDFLTGAFVGVGVEVARRMTDRRPMDPHGAAEFATRLFMGGIPALTKK